MKRIMMMTAGVLMTARAALADGTLLKKCANDAVVSGTVCMDTYEASVWRVPNPTTTNAALVQKIQQGKVTLANLTAGGATQLAVGSEDDYAPCTDDGQNCQNDIFAVSLPGVRPSANVTWFQAQAACKNARKRLPSSAEWQAAVLGTPDPGPDDGVNDCNTSVSNITVQTGSRPACRSADGAFDMVGNVSEWVAEWVPRGQAPCGSYPLTTDSQCLTGGHPGGGTEPAAITRGGGYLLGAFAGPLAIRGDQLLTTAVPALGFRCAR